MLQKKISGEQVNTMVSDQYEIYHVKDVVSQNKTIYHHHDFYEIHATLKQEVCCSSIPMICIVSSANLQMYSSVSISLSPLLF